MNKISYSMLVLVISMVFVLPSVSAIHTATADLQPEWSPAGGNVNYTVNITNDGPDAIREFRIISDPTYEEFTCGDVDGWREFDIQVFTNNQFVDACLYITNSTDAITAGNYEVFPFSAIVPSSGCNRVWYFETRDEETVGNGAWNSINDTTSVDDVAPIITKILEGISQYEDGTECPNGPGQGEECWITQDSIIDVWVVDDGERQCPTPSLVDYCEVNLVYNRGLIDGMFNGQEWPKTWTAPTCDVPALKAQGMTAEQIIIACGKIHEQVQFTEDSTHELQISCYDNAGNEVVDNEIFKVDTTPPETIVDYNDPVSRVDGSVWIDTVSSVILTATDNKIGVEETLYKNNWIIPEEGWDACAYPETFCNANFLSDFANEGANWQTYIDPFSGGEESCHILEYYSYDFIGNTEDTKYECFYVDKTPPSTWFGINSPSEMCDPNDPSGCDYWITDESTVNLFCEDVGPHPSNQVSLMYRTWDDISEQWTNWVNAETLGGPNDKFEVMTRVSFGEDSVHKVQYYCEDAVGKTNGTEEDPYEVVVRVDMTAPEITKKVIGPQEGQCPPRPGTDDVCFVTDKTEIAVSVIDPDPSGKSCNINDVTCSYTVEWEDEIVDRGLFDELGTSIYFNEDSEHILSISCQDGLGNTVEDVESFLVDIEPPATTKSIGEPFVETWYPKYCNLLDQTEKTTLTTPAWPLDCQLAEYITSQTLITLSATDEKVGVDKTFWRNYVIEDPSGFDICGNPEQYCNPEGYANYIGPELDWTEYTGPFSKPEESCHVIEYYSVDKFGYEELINSNCLFVDNTEPEGTKTVGEPSIEGDMNPIDWYVSPQTSIQLSCTDVGDHPVDNVEVCYYVGWENEGEEVDLTEQYCNGEMDDLGNCCVSHETQLSFEEDSYHTLEYFCKDALGNENEADEELFAVDSVPPITTKTILEPFYIEEVCDEGCWDVEYIDTATRIELTAEDPEPHPSGIDSTWYRISLVRDEYCGEPEEYCMANEGDKGWIQYSEPFGINEESCHMVEYMSKDGLGNYEQVQTNCMFVDKKAPDINKEFFGPFYENEFSEWITTETEILPVVFDPEPHPSGVNKVSYRVTQVEDEACRNEEACFFAEGTGDFFVWDMESTFNIDEESCHLIEIYAEDNVEKNTMHKQCVFVDETDPEPRKEVGLPKSPMSEANQNLGAEFFPELGEGICDEEGKCWDVTLMTPISLECEDILPHPSGEYQACFMVSWDGDDITEDYCDSDLEDGYCCVTEGSQFHFAEETWHKFEYFCEDNVGNVGEVDTEYFKVEGDSFVIQLNKKYNLISVPFRLIDNSMDEVFAPIADKVVSVWHFDGSEWKVYSPDGNPANDDLTTMEPGWGYFVLTTEEAELVVGGSLFSPVVAPPSIPIVHGWNLIGYYGHDGKEGYFGPISDESPIGSTNPAYCTLASVRTSLWDTNTPTLETYWEPYNPNSWLSLNPLFHSDWMDAGAGYWLLYTDPAGAIYAKSNTCGDTLV